MKTVPLGKSPLRSSRLAYGGWRLAGTAEAVQVTPEREAHGCAAVIVAYEAGFTLFDLADIYCDGVAEHIFGLALQEVAGMRDRIVIATKCGIRKAGHPDPHAPYRYDFSKDHILRSCEESLRRMGVETIDLYQLHRPDFLGDPTEVASAFAQLKQEGKVREFGVSNFRPSQVTLLQSACPLPLVANQIEISLAQLTPLLDGTLDQCLASGLTPMAWSPLAGGRLAGGTRVSMQDADHARKQKLYDVMDLLARERGVSRSQIALAWLLKHPSGIIPIIGTTNPERILEAQKACDLQLTREEWYRLFEAAYGQKLP
jgi:predicted oxidoreductase